MEFIQIYDSGVAQYAYLIGCEETREAVLIDPQRYIEPYLEEAKAHDLEIVAIAETHIHADFLTGTQEFLEHTEVKAYLSSLGAGEGWNYEWAAPYGDRTVMLADGDTFKVGALEVIAVHTPGHTPEHLTFLVKEAGANRPMGAVTGDFIFVGDLGRPDLLETAAKAKGAMKKGAESLYKSVKKFMSEPDSLLIWPGHGAGSACGKALRQMPHSSWGYEKLTSPALQIEKEDDFVAFITSDQVEPPLYFARMKNQNKSGKKLLPKAAELRNIDSKNFAGLLAQNDIIILDAREDQVAVMKSRVPDSFYAPFSSMFSTAVGSVIENADAEIVVICAKEHSHEIYRRLVNIGYDRLARFVTPETLLEYFEETEEPEEIDVIDFAELKKKMEQDSLQVIDVRSSAEYDEKHIEGAINAPYTRLPEFLERIPSSGRLFVHCGTGMRASVASVYLARQGHDVVLINDSFSSY